LNPLTFTSSNVKNLNTCCSVFCVVSVTDQSGFMDLSMVFNLWTDPGFIFESHS